MPALSMQFDWLLAGDRLAAKVVFRFGASLPQALYRTMHASLNFVLVKQLFTSLTLARFSVLHFGYKFSFAYEAKSLKISKCHTT